MRYPDGSELTAADRARREQVRLAERPGERGSGVTLPDPKIVDNLAALLVERLTEREREVFFLLAWGPSNRQLARRLGITERTVKAHISKILCKAAVDTRAQLCVMSYSYGQRLYQRTMDRGSVRLKTDCAS